MLLLFNANLFPDVCDDEIQGRDSGHRAWCGCGCDVWFYSLCDSGHRVWCDIGYTLCVIKVSECRKDVILVLLSV